jgi:glycosyltransferase involved in cell wall biosynthesis
MSRIIPQDLPELSDVGRLGDTIGTVFDDLAADRVRRLGWNLDVFIGGGACLNQMYALGKPHTTPTRCVTTWFSSYAEHAQRVLKAEYAEWGIQREPIHPYLVWRAMKEQELSDVVIVPSEYCKSTYPVETQKKARVVQFGVDSDEFKPLPGGGFDAPHDLQVLMPATNPYRKGLRTAIGAIKLLPPNKWHFTVTGSVQGKPEGAAAGLPILFTGWVPNAQMKVFYQAHDVVISPSVEEGSALAVLEAMACGKPVVVSPETGHDIQDGKQGFIVPSREPKKLADALQYFIDNAQERKRMGQEARRYAEKMTWDRFASGFIQVIEEGL